MRANIVVRGLSCTWSIDTDLSEEEFKNMRADGVPVGWLVYEEQWEPGEDEGRPDDRS